MYSVDENISSCIKEGDIILEFNGQEIKNSLDFRLSMYKIKPDQKVTLKVNRGGEILELECSALKKV